MHVRCRQLWELTALAALDRHHCCMRSVQARLCWPNFLSCNSAGQRCVAPSPAILPFDQPSYFLLPARRRPVSASPGPLLLLLLAGWAAAGSLAGSADTGRRRLPSAAGRPASGRAWGGLWDCWARCRALRCGGDPCPFLPTAGVLPIGCRLLPYRQHRQHRRHRQHRQHRQHRRHRRQQQQQQQQRCRCC